MNAEAVITALLAAAILASVPVMLAAVGEAIGERAGLLNLGIEGVMLLSAFTSFWTTLESGSIPLGLLVGSGVGILIGAMFAVLTGWFHADQVVLGLGMTIAGTGGSAFLFREVFGSNQPLLSHAMGRPFHGRLDWLPVLGPAVGQQRWFVFVAVGLVIGCHLILNRTALGLRIRAAGESPLGLEAVGGDVRLTRLTAASLAGGFYGLGGAALSLVELGFFLPGVTMGAGFLAVALAMLGRREPLRVAMFALLFGVLAGLDTGLQVADVRVRTEFLQMLPYLGIVLAVIVAGRNQMAPRALGRPYRGIGQDR